MAIDLCEDADLLRFEPNLETWCPRSQDGAPRCNWAVYRNIARDQIERHFRASKSTSEPFELGRIDPRSRERLKDPAACLSLHYLFVGEDVMGDATAFFVRKAAHYKEMATSMLDQESLQLDYDSDNSGAIDEDEKSQPMPNRFLRG